MKRYLIRWMVISISMMLILVSCNKFGDVNTDPTQSSNLDPALQLALVQLRFSGDPDINERVSVIETMPLVQQIGGDYENRYGFEYVEDRQYMSDLWEIGYPNDVLNIVDAVARTSNNPAKTNLNAICRIMKVYIFARLLCKRNISNSCGTFWGMSLPRNLSRKLEAVMGFSSLTIAACALCTFCCRSSKWAFRNFVVSVLPSSRLVLEHHFSGSAVLVVAHSLGIPSTVKRM